VSAGHNLLMNVPTMHQNKTVLAKLLVVKFTQAHSVKKYKPKCIMGKVNKNIFYTYSIDTFSVFFFSKCLYFVIISPIRIF